MPGRHVLLAVVVMVLWGVNFVILDVALDSFPPLLLVSLRFLFVAFPAVFFLRRPDVKARYVIGVGAFMSGGQFALLFVAMDQGMPAGLASLVLQLQVLFTIGLAVGLLGERLTGAQVAGAGIAFAGMLVIAGGRGGHVPLGALALSVGAAFSWAIGNVIMRRAQASSPLNMIVWASLVPPVPLALMSLWLEGPGEIGDALSSPELSGILALAYVVVVSTMFAYGAWAWLMRRHAASRVAPFTLMVPPVGMFSAWLALGENPNAAELSGAVVVLIGLALTTRAMVARVPAPVAATATASSG
jgi:O-acetylserine/cysteine efflux transporter